MKRFICLCVLVASYLCFLLPEKAWAAETSGTCGKKATWSLDETTGTLTISGAGVMELDLLYPWPDIKNVVTRIVIEEGITGLCDKAFVDFTEVTEVVLPESIQVISQWAFNGCVKLKSINLHDKIKEIGSSCFVNTALTEVTLPKGITRIEGSTFLNCTSLTKVICQSETIQIGDNAFKGCTSLTEIKLQGSGITDIGSNAFDGCIQLKSIPLDGDLYRISKEAFRGCTSLKELVLPDGVGYLYENAFAFSGLERITLGKNVHDIDADTFKDCPSLKFIEVDTENPNFHNDENGALYDTARLTLRYVPQGFSGEFTVEAGTKLIGSYAASNCVGITDLVMPDGVQEIKDNAFWGCSNLESVVFSDSIYFIDHAAFFGCTSLKAIDLPLYIQAIDYEAFANCESLKDITFYGFAGIHDDAFLNVTATVHYPSYLHQWENYLGDYGGKLTWEPYQCSDHLLVTTPITEPTCTKTGWTGLGVCAHCGITLQEAETIPATGHTFGEWKIIDSSMEEGVWVEHSCKDCGYAEQKFLDPLEMGPTVPYTDPTEFPTDPTEATDPTTEPTQTPTQPTIEPTQPAPTSSNDNQSTWIIIVVSVLIIAGGGAAGFTFSKKSK